MKDENIFKTKKTFDLIINKFINAKEKLIFLLKKKLKKIKE